LAIESVTGVQTCALPICGACKKEAVAAGTGFAIAMAKSSPAPGGADGLAGGAVSTSCSGLSVAVARFATDRSGSTNCSALTVDLAESACNIVALMFSRRLRTLGSA
jgi:hypothetical protein